MEKRGNNFKDVTGHKYGRLTIIRLSYVKNRKTYWECLCDCGTITVKTGEHVRNGFTKSCGCLYRDTRRILKSKSGFNKLYKTYKNGAVSRNYSFELSEQDFERLTKQNCHYCNAVPNTVMCVNYRYLNDENEHGRYIYNGIDRKNNKLGYTIENSVSCCKICNRAKSGDSYEEFMSYINQIKGRK